MVVSIATLLQCGACQAREAKEKMTEGKIARETVERERTAKEKARIFIPSRTNYCKTFSASALTSGNCRLMLAFFHVQLGE